MNKPNTDFDDLFNDKPVDDFVFNIDDVFGDSPATDTVAGESKGDPNWHPLKCRCSICGNTGRGRHPLNCRCEKCLASKSKTEQESTINLESKYILKAVESVNKIVKKRTTVWALEPTEEQMLSEIATNLLNKYAEKFAGYLTTYPEELALIAFIGLYLLLRLEALFKDDSSIKDENFELVR